MRRRSSRAVKRRAFRASKSKSHTPVASPPVGFAFRALTAVAAVALGGLGVVAVRPLDGRLRPVLAVGAVVAGVVACRER